ncbi:hypothetical protein [Aliiruegeria sabulilitoris]|uniref:hypothetical protein n=1 Tax=Aliiruegeria sabulilitoris TaxID=1510458 RepID=UPI0008327FA2|nr:hypothetical protein [Aliiruegeria sabulilitoris]NDR57642.1 hypothetical protein [Pseudoruegeria sp. M32A2M]
MGRTERTWLLGLAGALALTALPALADSIEVPEGCEGFLTVQQKGCGVSHYWRCEAAPEGTAWEVHYDVEGVYSLSVYDHDFQWLDSQYFRQNTREHLTETAPDPASLGELLETGQDSYAFVIREEGPEGIRDVVHQGEDRLTGRTVVIDGVELLETEYTSTAMDADSGEEIFAVAGNQYVLAEERLFFLGADSFLQDGEEMKNDFSPVRFIRPGEAGFTEMTPLYGCNATEEIGYLPPASAQRKEKRNDDL